jgi:DNA-directed RNA polymerase sigma subunit (sigma70/sigma32)
VKHHLSATFAKLLAERLPPGGFGALYRQAGYESLNEIGNSPSIGLTDREAACVALRLCGHTYDEISVLIGAGTRERVRQILAKSVTKIVVAESDRITSVDAQPIGSLLTPDANSGKS